MNNKLLIVSGLCVGILTTPLYAGQPLPTLFDDITATTHINKVEKGNGACSSPDDIRTEETNYFDAIRAVYKDLHSAIIDTDQGMKLNYMLGSFFDQSLNRQPASPEGIPKVPRTVVSH